MVAIFLVDQLEFYLLSYAEGVKGHSSALGAQIGGMGHPSGLVIAGQGTWSLGGAIGQKLLQVAFTNMSEIRAFTLSSI